MPDSALKADGVMGSLRRIASSVAGLLRTRAELFAVELQEEKLRAVTLLLWLSLGVALGTAGMLVAIGTLALYLWQHAGYAGLVGLAVLTLAASAGILLFIRHRLLRGPLPFAGTVAEFKKDAACLHRPE